MKQTNPEVSTKEVDSQPASKKRRTHSKEKSTEAQLDEEPPAKKQKTRPKRKDPAPARSIELTESPEPKPTEKPAGKKKKRPIKPKRIESDHQTTKQEEIRLPSPPDTDPIITTPQPSPVRDQSSQLMHLPEDPSMQTTQRPVTYQESPRLVHGSSSTVPHNSDDVYQMIQNKIVRHKNDKVSRQPLEIETILSRLPYREMMESLFGGKTEITDNIPIVTRDYEEYYMREANTEMQERPCVMGQNCECNFIDPKIPFVGVEFVLPGEEAKEDEVQMCVLCSRKVTKQLFNDLMTSDTEIRGIIQRYGNICNQPGEYAKQAMIFCPPNKAIQCMPLPMVDHQRNRYTVKIHNGQKIIKQSRVSYEEFKPDFQ